MAFKVNCTTSGVDWKKDLNEANEKREKEIVPKKAATEINPKLSADVVKELENEVREVHFGSFTVKHLSASAAVRYLGREHDSQWGSIRAAEESHSDLLPGIYEGGLKIWECSLDLAKYLLENQCIKAKSSVLELGCGAGIPGLIAYLSGADVTFQDYNEEVLKSVTIANVTLNTNEDDWEWISQKCRFIAGDWENIQTKYYGQDSSNITLYDVILTSETIYADQNHKKLLELMKCALKPTGVIYLAAKSYYFGVGGGTADFEALVDDDGVLEVSEVFNISKGVGREILLLKFRNA